MGACIMWCEHHTVLSVWGPKVLLVLDLVKGAFLDCSCQIPIKSILVSFYPGSAGKVRAYDRLRVDKINSATPSRVKRAHIAD